MDRDDREEKRREDGRCDREEGGRKRKMRLDIEDGWRGEGRTEREGEKGDIGQRRRERKGKLDRDDREEKRREDGRCDREEGGGKRKMRLDREDGWRGGGGGGKVGQRGRERKGI